MMYSEKVYMIEGGRTYQTHQRPDTYALDKDNK